MCYPSGGPFSVNSAHYRSHEDSWIKWTRENCGYNDWRGPCGLTAFHVAVLVTPPGRTLHQTTAIPWMDESQDGIAPYLDVEEEDHYGNTIVDHAAKKCLGCSDRYVSIRHWQNLLETEDNSRTNFFKADRLRGLIDLLPRHESNQGRWQGRTVDEVLSYWSDEDVARTGDLEIKQCIRRKRS